MESFDSQLTAKVFSCIDHTTLNATDSDASVEAFCRKALELQTTNYKLQTIHVAAVCVYPRFVGVAKRTLEGSPVRVASVAGAFPHGQLPLHLKVEEVRYAVGEGADEVDIVLSRGALLSGEDTRVRDEVAAMKQACGRSHLKVILETGELPTTDLIKRAADLAIAGGADFIKTSTGKIAVGATPESAEAMLATVADHRQKTGRTVGFKAAGGIRTPAEALRYARLAQQTMGDHYLHPATFRIGASSLTEALLASVKP